MPDTFNYTNEWDFSNRHLDSNIGGGANNDFFSAARCILYVQPSSTTTPDQKSFKRLGVVQGFTFYEQKNIDSLYELGSDLPYLVPGRVAGQLSIQKVLLNGEDLINLTYIVNPEGNGQLDNSGFISSLRDSRTNNPFDLLFAYYGSKTSTPGKFEATYSRLFKNCYFQSRTEGINAGSVIVMEQIGIMYEYIANVDFLTNSGNSANRTSFRGTVL